VVSALDVNALLDQVDLNVVLGQVDIDRLPDRPGPPAGADGPQ
jgi:hypothetical protein